MITYGEYLTCNQEKNMEWGNMLICVRGYVITRSCATPDWIVFVFEFRVEYSKEQGLGQAPRPNAGRAEKPRENQLYFVKK